MELTERFKTNLTDESVKQMIIERLIKEGYVTYAKRLMPLDLIVADMVYGEPVDVACMIDSEKAIFVNPGFLNAANEAEQETQLSRLSVVVRHELLHFLLVHAQRFKDHIEAIDPTFEKEYKDCTAGQLAKLSNYAADWELSERGYDAYDKEVVRNMAINGRVVGGLILEDQHPEWLGKTYEEIFDLLVPELKKAIADAKKNQAEITLHRAQHTAEYKDAYNKIIKLFNDKKYTDADIEKVLNKIENDEISIEDLLDDKLSAADLLKD